MIKNKSAFFKALNMLASKMEVIDTNTGKLVNDRGGRLKTAYSVIVKLRDAESFSYHIGTMFKRDQMTTFVQLVSKAGIEVTQAPAKEQKKVAPKKKKQKNIRVAKKTTLYKARTVKPKTVLEVPVYTGLDFLEGTFTADQIDVMDKIIQFELKMPTKTFCERFEAGMNALHKATSIEDLQYIFITFLGCGHIERTINKFMTHGVGYKKRTSAKTLAKQNVESKMSYQNAPTSNGMINQNRFSLDDVYQQLIADAIDPELDFGHETFDDIKNYFQTVYYRISNVVQVFTRKSVNEKKSKAEQKQEQLIEAMENSDVQDAIKLAEEMGIFSESEMDIIKMRLAGYNKSEIDKKVGQRTDRTFNKLKELYIQAV